MSTVRWSDTKIVASITDLRDVKKAEQSGADVIEMRLDLMNWESPGLPSTLREEVSIPIIVTLRSKAEGGTFRGTAKEWFHTITKYSPIADFIDIERSYRHFARSLQEDGKKVIASYHSNRMLTLSELIEIEKELRAYGDIPKIVPTPSTQNDIITLLTFTANATKPICTGTQGVYARYGRILLALFGSEFAYCHVGNPTAEGQYHIAEFKSLLKQLME